MSLKQQIKDLYLARKLQPLHSIHDLIAHLEKQLYWRGVLSSKNLTLPTFLGIGAAKAGTSWLYNMLSAHPDVFLPRTKELHYFDRRYNEVLYMYTRKFRDAQQAVIGEITPAYGILTPERIRFVHLLMPDVKLIYIMRNPIERAWSEAMHNLLRKGNQRNLEDVPEEEIETILYSDAITQRSAYTECIDNWLSIYPKEQLLILFYDDLKADPQGFLETVFQHIGVRSDIDWDQIPIEERFNVNPKTQIPEKFLTMLEHQYCAEIEQLYQRFGDKVADWRCPD